jgi:undecaprenyl diphosphate synthase
MSLLPVELQERIKAIQEHTKDNKGGDFNVCFSYSGTNEITSAVKQVIHETIEDSNSERHCIAESDLERCLQLYGSPDLDMIVRTSGEIRLSDFMLWQASACCLAITDVLWPEFTPNHLYASVLYFQEHHDNLMVCTDQSLIDHWYLRLTLSIQAIRATLLTPQTVDDIPA